MFQCQVFYNRPIFTDKSDRNSSQVSCSTDSDQHTDVIFVTFISVITFSNELLLISTRASLMTELAKPHYADVIMTKMASQITSLSVVYSTVYSDADQIKHQSSASLAFVWGIHRDRWIPRTKGQLRGKCFHLMTSSWEHNVGHEELRVWLHTHALTVMVTT